MYDCFPHDAMVVQKYGGTSVGTPERIIAVAQRTARHVALGRKRLAIVVSAMSGETNRLVDLVRQVNADASGRAADMALAAGEQVAVGLTAAALEREGILAVPLLHFQLGIYTDTYFSKARIQQINTEKIFAAWNQGAIPVIAGFQGITPELEITTLGRGGSDTSAVAIACALKADFCEINTDVDGVYTADPRMVRAARLNHLLDFNVALEMAALGSKVLHSRCVELGAKYNLPIVVRNSFKPDTSDRTIIMALNARESLEAPVVSGVAVERNVARVTLSNIAPESRNVTRIFDSIAEAGVNVDIIIHNMVPQTERLQLGFTINTHDLVRLANLMQSLTTTPEFSELHVETEDELAKVSVIGLGMASHHGVASRTFGALSRAGIDIKMISTSEIKISCIVPQAKIEAAAQELHAEFF